jgi:hypothetical protein
MSLIGFNKIDVRADIGSFWRVFLDV